MPVKGGFHRKSPKGKSEDGVFRMPGSHIGASDLNGKGLQGSFRAGPRAKVTGMSGESATIDQPHQNGDGGGDADRIRRLRLHGFLRELVREEGRMEAADLLGVNYKTLVRAEESGHLTTRMRHALERLLLSGESPGADERDGRVDELARRLARLERGVEALAEEFRGGLVELRGADPARAGESIVKSVAAPVQRGRQEVVGGADVVIGLRTESRSFTPKMVREEPAPGDKVVYGEAWPLMEEWRRLRAAHPGSGSELPWLVTEERLLTLELAMLEEHGLTLPPETRPLRGAGRGVQTNWRRTALADIHRARVQAEVRGWVRRVVVAALLLALSAGVALLEGCGSAAALA